MSKFYKQTIELMTAKAVEIRHQVTKHVENLLSDRSHCVRRVEAMAVDLAWLKLTEQMLHQDYLGKRGDFSLDLILALEIEEITSYIQTKFKDEKVALLTADCIKAQDELREFVAKTKAKGWTEVPT